MADAKLEIQMRSTASWCGSRPRDGDLRSSGGNSHPATAKRSAKRLAWGDVMGVGNNGEHREGSATGHVSTRMSSRKSEIQSEAYLVMMRERTSTRWGHERTEQAPALYVAERISTLGASETRAAARPRRHSAVIRRP